MRQAVSGSFAARDLGHELWQLTTDAGTQIYIQGAGPNAAHVLMDTGITMLGLEWRDDGVNITVTGAEASLLRAKSAIIHDPKGRLFESLPLASFDSDARRFWKRVFGLMRVPGGRFFLGVLARRNRAQRGRDKE